VFTEGALAAVALPPLFQGEYLLHTSTSMPRIWARSVSGASVDDGWLAYIGSIVSWLIAEPQPFLVAADSNSAPENRAARLHQTLPLVNLRNGNLSQGRLYWQPRDPRQSESAAWIKGQNVLMIT
jgi:hypothetical protein